MNRKVSTVLFSFAVCANAIHAMPLQASPVGAWQLSTYHVPDGSFYANQTVCFKADNTWYSSSQANWNGAWFENDNDIQWYGNMPMPGAGSANNLATIGTGQLTSTGAMAGKYVEWAAPSTLPLAWDRHYTYTMSYLGAVCGGPK